MNHLKSLRLERGLTQQALANALQTNQQAINGYENRGVEPDFEMLIKLANYLGTSIDYLIGRTDDRFYQIENTGFVINTAEISMIEQFRKLSPAVQQHIAGLIEGYLI